MSSEMSKIPSENENLCVLCFKSVDIYSVGICDHPVCYECSTRMRVLCRQNECPICRGDMPKVIFTIEVEPFTSLFPKYSKSNLQDEKFGLIFANYRIEKCYNKLLEQRCSICPEHKTYPFKTFGQLKDHMRREHEMFYCDICVDNVKIFSSERRTYTRQELGIHRRKGDPDNTSHRGHPLCEFCDTRFLDSDELFRHLRRTHLFCHFCDADGRHLYYKNVEDLQKHFREEHFLCEEGECKSVPMASAFRTEIDFKAHIAAIHGKGLGKNASKQVRTLELAFTLAPRNNSRKNQGEYPRDNRNDDEGALGYEPASSGGGQDRIFHNPLTAMDFPALAGASNSNSSQLSSASLFPSRGNNGSNKTKSGVTITTSRNSEVSIRKNDFPALGKPSTSRESRVMLSVHNNQDHNAPKVSIQVNHKSNGSIHTQITTTTSSSQVPSHHKPVEAFPALGPPSKSSIQPQWVQVKSKKQAEKPSKVAPAPQLPTKDLNQFPNLTKGKLNKKTSSIQVPVSNNWVNLNALKKEPIAKTNNSKEKQKELEIPDISKNGKIEDRKKKKKGKTTDTYEQTDHKTISSVRENSGTGGVSENNIDPMSSSGSEDNNRNEVPKPPPGFKLPPPPGFTNKINEFPCLGLPNDLTFTTSSGQSYSITSIANNYKQPNNFSTRNQNIIKKLSMVSGNDIVNDFKVRSEMFRNGQLTSEKYYDYCKKVLGANFEDFFPEMLVLLPDIEKQQALYTVHTGKSKKHLLVCENCRQVILKKELSEHYKHHAFQSQFSSQVSTHVNNNNNAWNK